MILRKKIPAQLGCWRRCASRFAVGQLLAEGPSLRRAKRAILQQIAEATKMYAQEIDRLRPIADGVTDDDLRRYMSFEAERRKSIDEKAKANLVAITIGFTVLLASLNFIGKNELKAPLGGWWATLSFLLLISGVVYLIYGGLKALDALQIAQVYSPSGGDESGVSEAVRKVNLLWCLQQNEKTSLLRTNAVSVSYRSIRNGVFSLALLILVMAGRILIFLWRP
jgi:hypothetical protein